MSQTPEPLDPSAPDAPLIALIQLRDKNLIHSMSDEEIIARLDEIRHLTNQHLNLATRAKKESDKIAKAVGGKPSSAKALRQSILDDI